MLPMKCPRCRSRDIRAAITNNLFDDQTVRKRRCGDCDHVWFTVELQVNRYAVGWSRDHQSKPVLREQVKLEPELTPGGLVDQPD